MGYTREGLRGAVYLAGGEGHEAARAGGSVAAPEKAIKRSEGRRMGRVDGWGAE